jgi:hypothetical protein
MELKQRVSGAVPEYGCVRIVKFLLTKQVLDNVIRSVGTEVAFGYEVKRINNTLECACSL